MNKPKPSRTFIFDLLRIILIVLIINVHIRIIAYSPPNILEQFVYYAVPLFLILSFYFAGKYLLENRLEHNFLLLRIKRLFIPLLFWSFVGFAVNPQFFTTSNILLQIATGEVVNVPLYYLNLLLLFTIIFWFLTYVPLRLRVIAYVGIILLAFYLEYSKINYQIFKTTVQAVKNSYGRFTELAPYAPVGLFFSLLALKTKIQKTGWLFLTLISAVFYILVKGIPQPPGFHYSGMEIFFASITIFSFVLFLSGVKINSSFHRAVEILGKYSFGIYLFHFALLEFLLKFFPYLKNYIINSSIPFLIIYVFFCYALCIGFNVLTHRKFSFLFE